MPRMKLMLVAIATLIGLVATTEVANAVVYCTYIDYPYGCVARPGVRLVARPVGVGHVGVGRVGVGHVTAPRPGNRNGGVNRVGRRR
jgi:hypothetical protein